MKTGKKLSLKQTTGWMILFSLILLIAVVLPSCNSNNKQAEGSNTEIAPPPPPPPPPAAKTDSDTPFVEVDEMPVFKVGDVAIIDFVKNNVKYPEASKLNGSQGKVIVRFAVEAD